MNCHMAMIIAAALLAGSPVRALHAQEPRLAAGLDSSVTPQPTVSNRDLRQLPADSVEDVLQFAPAVTSTDDGLSIRGSEPGRRTIVIDGFDLSPASRMVHPALPVSAIRSSSLGDPTPDAASYQPARLQYLLGADSTLGSWGRYATDRLLGASSLGINRLDAAFGERLRTTSTFIAFSMQGQKSREFGADARAIPLFQNAGTDTVIATPDGAFPLPAYPETRGSCDLFAGSSDARIASNYGEGCTGDRVPGSASTALRFAAGLTTPLGQKSTLDVRTMRSRDSRRLFRVTELDIPLQRSGAENRWSAHTLRLTSPFGRGRGSGILQLGIARQSSERLSGPLTPEGEMASRDPAGGLMFSGLDFRFNPTSFPIDSILVDNVRRNNAAERMLPYPDDEAQRLILVDRYLQGPWGITGLPESGGPSGVVSIYQERQTSTFATATWQTSRNARITLAGTYAWLGVDAYESAIVSSALLDVFTVQPRKLSLSAFERFAYDAVRLDLGVRFDRFRSGAERSYVLDTLQSTPSGPNPRYGVYYPFPRISSYTDADGMATIDGQQRPLTMFVADESHSAWSPSAALRVEIRPGTALLLSALRTAYMPDLFDVLTGINTDIALTNGRRPFSTDMGYETGWSWQAGIVHTAEEGAEASLVGFVRSSDHGLATVTRNETDPARGGALIPLPELRDARVLRARGIVATGGWRRGQLALQGALTLQRIHSRIDPADGFAIPDAPATWERPRSFNAILQYDSHQQRAGPRRNHTTMALGLRWASGLPYTSCPPIFENSHVLSGERCASGSGEILSARLPSIRELDLRFSTSLSARPGAMTVFVDARNLLNTQNLVRVFAATGARTNPEDRNRYVGEWLLQLANEFAANGVRQGDGNADLRFGSAGAGGCSSWIGTNGDAGAPSCVSLIRAEARWGNGDGLYTTAEQQHALDAFYHARFGTGFLGAPRRMRVGLEFRF